MDKFYKKDDLTAISQYFKEVRDNEVLAYEDEQQLFDEYRSGSREAYNKLAESNARLVISIAKRYQNRGVSFEDLIQEGNTGLLIALDKFDPSKGYKFSTYATWWITQTVLRSVYNAASAIRIPVHTGEKIVKMNAISERLASNLGRVPTDQELANEMKVSVETIRRWKTASIPVVSIDTPIGEDDTVLEDFLVADYSLEDEVVNNSLREDIDTAFQDLTENEQFVLAHRFGLADGCLHTLEEVGNALGLTRERVRQIQKNGLKKLKENPKYKYLSDYTTKKSIDEYRVFYAMTRKEKARKQKELEDRKVKAEALYYKNDDGSYIFDTEEMCIINSLYSDDINRLATIRTVCDRFDISPKRVVEINRKYCNTMVKARSEMSRKRKRGTKK